MKTIFKIKDAHSDRIQIDYLPERDEYFVSAFGEHVGFLSGDHAVDIADSILAHQKELSKEPKAKKAAATKAALVAYNAKVKAYVAANPNITFKEARTILKDQK
jgi:hypothetical protein